MKHVINSEITLETTYEYPPIPIRWMDWSCIHPGWYDGASDAGPQIVGTGRTEQEAINDWMEQYNEM